MTRIKAGMKTGSEQIDFILILFILPFIPALIRVPLI
jgi:hypothetical protein